LVTSSFVYIAAPFSSQNWLEPGITNSHWCCG